MRKIDTIIIHCSATKAWQDFTAKDIDSWHRKRGFDGIGYHYVIRLNGKIEKGRNVEYPGAHCPDWNTRSIGICYIGGLDANGKPADTRTKAQKRILYQLIRELQRDYPGVNLVIGHRDTSPDLNRNGVIEPCEFVKACPCFDVKEFMRTGHSMLLPLLALLLLPFWLSACGSVKSVERRDMNCDSVEQLHFAEHAASRVKQMQKIEEQEEEHMEETVFVFTKDTVTGDSFPSVMYPAAPLMLMKRTVVGRKVAKAVETEHDDIKETGGSVKALSEMVKKETVVDEKKRDVNRVWIIVGGVAIILWGLAIRANIHT
ncbi:N-acetylmuramoyl-L-alanine amidase [Bacteroides nordii]|uniref:N-acetylmuramoyl-L-alanine amidase n=1 Tax=Bacteroides nordii TaxID=291645 RepID=A0A413V3Q0_9BACE|nr:N-acetylmuramoyl-L-alanine amidase [Bacteroides nordii]RHB28194.1 N-acetylmuramoyl-L-alanine amidase [Bacteroides nordii]